MNKRIDALQQLIEEEKRKQDICKHAFGSVFYNPSVKKEGYGYHCVAQGSDVWGEFDGYRDVEVPRWTHECLLCGYEEHTFKKKLIVVGEEPDFS